MKALILFLLIGQTSEPPELEPICSPLEQYYHGMQLVQVNIDPEDLQGQAFYYKKLVDGSRLIVRMTRASCKAEWRPVQSKVFPVTKPCPPGASCL